MNILAIETSSDRGTVAVQSGTEISTIEIAGVREQSARIVPAIDSLLGRAGVSLASLDAITFGRGPGSFTGVRLAASVAQGLAMATDIGIVPVSSLAALAQQAVRRDRITHALACVDARMAEVYWGEYDAADGIARLVGREHLSAPERVECPPAGTWAAVGSGFARFGEVLSAQIARATVRRTEWLAAAVDLLPLARAALTRGEAVPADQVTPSYLREEDAWVRD